MHPFDFFKEKKQCPVRLEKQAPTWEEQHIPFLTNAMWICIIIAALLAFYIIWFWIISPHGSPTNWHENLWRMI